MSDTIIQVGTVAVDLDFTESAAPATVEQLVLAALLRAPQATAQRYLTHLDAEDFSKGSHRAILASITTVADTVSPTAPLVLADLRETGQLTGEHGLVNRNELQALVTVDADPNGFLWLAIAVAAAAIILPRLGVPIEQSWPNGLMVTLTAIITIGGTYRTGRNTSQVPF